MGIETKESQKLRSFKILANRTYEEVLAEVSDNNIAKVEHILADNSIGATYKDHVAFKALIYVPSVAIDDNTTDNIYVLILSTDAVERALQEANNNIHTTMAAVDMLLTDFLPIIMN